MVSFILSIGITLGNLVFGPSNVSGIDSIQDETTTFIQSNLYKPPVLSADAKSLRMVNLHSAVGLPKGAMELFIQHRFGTVNSTV